MGNDNKQGRLTFYITVFPEGFYIVDPWGKQGELKRLGELDKMLTMYDALRLDYVVEDTRNVSESNDLPDIV